MSEDAPSNQVLANELRHVSRGVDDVKATLDRVLGLVQGAATKDEMASVRQEVATLRSDHTLLKGEVTGQATRIRALEDANTSAAAVVSLAKWVVSIGGLTILGGLARWWLLNP